MRDVVGIGAHHALDLPVLEEFLRIVLEMEHDARAARRRVRQVDGLDGECAAAVRRPDDRLRRCPRAREITSTFVATMKAE